MRFRLVESDGPITAVELVGLPPDELRRAESAPTDDLDAALRVTVVADQPDLPSIVGSVEVDDDVLRFRPRFPIGSDLTLRCRFDADSWNALSGSARSESLEQTLYSGKVEERRSTVVRAVYPSSRTLPQNTLRLYVQFSAPMDTRSVQRHVHLRHAESGERIDEAFVDLEHGLWSGDDTRLTLFMHPGRVKTNVGPNRALGLAMKPGDVIELVVGAEARDANGHELARDYSQTYEVIEADREAIRPASWHVQAPIHGSPLLIDFGESLDHGLANRLLGVFGPDGRPLEGTVELGPGESTWSFRPASAWTDGTHRIVIDPELEDVAGNTTLRLFDQKAETKDLAPRLELSFEVR